jgi:hypothetical protein
VATYLLPIAIMQIFFISWSRKLILFENFQQIPLAYSISLEKYQLHQAQYNLPEEHDP